MKYSFIEGPTDDSSKELMSQYPQQDDPDYWKKVPELFSQEFNSEEKFNTFKSNWIVTKVPLVIKEFDGVLINYFKDAIRLVIENYGEERDAWIKLFEEPRDGHTTLSYDTMVKRFEVQHNDEKIFVSNVSPVRALRVHNIVKYQTMTNKKVADYDNIVEIGGGYGDFIKLARQMGFKGNYYDIDFDPINKIASHYNSDTENNYFFNHIDQLPELSGSVLVVSTWAFSEVPMEYKKAITKRLANCDWLTTFQCDVFGMDNLNYFINDFGQEIGRKLKFFNITWHLYQGGNLYAITE
jgi:hypothetical protein